MNVKQIEIYIIEYTIDLKAYAHNVLYFTLSFIWLHSVELQHLLVIYWA